MTKLQIGTRISGGPYNEGIGIVTRVEQAPDSGVYTLGRGMTPVTAYVDIAWPTHECKHSAASIYEGLPYRIHDGLGTDDDIATLRAAALVHQAEAKAKGDEAAAAFAAAKVRLASEYSYLLREDKGGSLTLAAKNVRILLKRAFPTVKFSVTTERYSGGNSLSVSWVDGPNSDQVKAIAQPFAGGTFDGMTDCYEYSRSPWTELFGEAKYVSCKRHYSDAMVTTVLGRVARYLGGLDRDPTLEDYRNGNLYQIKQSGGCDLSREVSVALSKHTFCIGKAAA